jgi:hypothetical protein
MFSRDTNHYRATPRTLQSSKAGPYARLTTARSEGWAVKLACALLAVVIGLMIGWRG